MVPAAVDWSALAGSVQFVAGVTEMAVALAAEVRPQLMMTEQTFAATAVCGLAVCVDAAAVSTLTAASPSIAIEFPAPGVNAMAFHANLAVVAVQLKLIGHDSVPSRTR